MGVILNWKPMKMEDFLIDYKEDITGQRLFYCLKTNSDRNDDIFKIGVSHSKNHNRLVEYIRQHGLNVPKKPCSGVMIYYVRGWKFNEDVQISKTMANRAEKKIKDILKPANLKERFSTERFDVELSELKRVINRYTKNIEPAKSSGPKPLVRSNPTKKIYSKEEGYEL